MVFHGNTQRNPGCQVQFRPVKVDLADLDPSVLAERAFYVFGDQEAMVSLYGEDISRRCTKLDFNKNYVVSIQQGLCPTGGYRIAVKDITIQKEKIKITVSFIQPRPDELVTLTMTMPYVLFTVPRTSFVHEPIIGFYTEDGEHLGDRKPICGKVQKFEEVWLNEKNPDE
jgi:hypothetical protein